VVDTRPIKSNFILADETSFKGNFIVADMRPLLKSNFIMTDMRPLLRVILMRQMRDFCYG
jgi:hypothetical protein